MIKQREMSITIQNYLKTHNLNITSHRKVILEFFLMGNAVLSHADIEKQLDEEIDRVTIYRTLNVFVEKGVLHKISDYDGITKYALCRDDCDENRHQDNHAHFKCVSCEEIVCLENTTIPDIKLPDKYVIQETNLFISGVCNQCQ